LSKKLRKIADYTWIGFRTMTNT